MILGSSVTGAVVALAVLVTTIAACRPGPPEAADYVSKVAASRAAKDQQFKSTNRPLPESRKAKFLPLAYYPIDPDYNVPGVLKLAREQPTLMMPTSTGGQRQMRRVGSIEFTVQNQRMKLTAFIEVGAPDMNLLFVPFTDATNGTETYSAGRYLDLNRNAAGAYDVDFNYAYLPYCYFNETYECPYPPAENRLPLPIYAGERLKP